MTAPTCRGLSSKDTAIKTDDDWNRRRRSALFFFFVPWRPHHLPDTSCSTIHTHRRRSNNMTCANRFDTSRRGETQYFFRFVVNKCLVLRPAQPLEHWTASFRRESLPQVFPHKVPLDWCVQYTSWAWLSKLHTFRRWGEWETQIAKCFCFELIINTKHESIDYLFDIIYYSRLIMESIQHEKYFSE